METTNIVDFARRDEMTDALTDLLAQNRSSGIDRDSC